jgi:hypothetical protein
MEKVSVPVPENVIRFLLGEGHLHNLHFGEKMNGKPFWWREYLRKALAAAPAELSDAEIDRQKSEPLSREQIEEWRKTLKDCFPWAHPNLNKLCDMALRYRDVLDAEPVATVESLQAEVEMLRGEVVNRNQRALDGDKATAAFNAEYERAEQHRIRAESAERKLAEYTDERGIVRCRNIATCLDTENKLAEAVAALRKYGRHEEDCMFEMALNKHYKCTCGFDEVTK